MGNTSCRGQQAKPPEADAFYQFQTHFLRPPDIWSDYVLSAFSDQQLIAYISVYVQMPALQKTKQNKSVYTKQSCCCFQNKVNSSLMDLKHKKCTGSKQQLFPVTWSGGMVGGGMEGGV